MSFMDYINNKYWILGLVGLALYLIIFSIIKRITSKCTKCGAKGYTITCKECKETYCEKCAEKFDCNSCGYFYCSKHFDNHDCEGDDEEEYDNNELIKELATLTDRQLNILQIVQYARNHSDYEGAIQIIKEIKKEVK